jgi:hypothetical protein
MMLGNIFWHKDNIYHAWDWVPICDGENYFPFELMIFCLN